MPRGIYKRATPGFLHPQNEHRVTVGVIGSVYIGCNKREAEREFQRWVKLSSDSLGRASGQAVIHEVNGKIEKEHMP